MNTAPIVQEYWNYCNVLRDNSAIHGDYVEQLTYLSLLKIASELPASEVIAAEIVEVLETALEQFREILGDMGEPAEESA